MRNFSLFLLLTTSAIPAMAAPDDGTEESRRASQSEVSDTQPRRTQRVERTERREVRELARRQIQVERQQDGRQETGAAVTVTRDRFPQARQQQGEQQQVPSARSESVQRYQRQQAPQQQVATEHDERRKGDLQRRRDMRQEAAGGQLVPRVQRIRTIPQTTPQIGQTGPTRTDATVRRRHDRDNRNRWSSQWRNDDRYNWRRHRDRYRATFRIGSYYDPFGYGYSRFGIGSYLYPNYYQSSFWINDPWQYRLPPAYGPYRWVRYHNDAVLIDTWTGEVVDVIYGFFW